MKSRKKWSIPISLAVVLMLAAMVGLAGIVQAQTPEYVTGGGDFIEDADKISDSTVITKIGVRLAVDAKDNAPAIPGLGLKQRVVVAEVDGADSALFDLSQKSGEVGKAFTTDVNVKKDGPKDSAGKVEYDPLDKVKSGTKSVFTFDVVVWVDTNTNSDTGKGYRGPDADADTASGDATTADKADDRDTSYPTTVTLYVPKVDPSDDLKFATIPETAITGDYVLDDAASDAEVKWIEITGVPSKADGKNVKIVGVSDGNANGAEKDAFDAQLKNGRVAVKYQVDGIGGDGKFISSLTGGASLKDRVAASFTIAIDTDTSVDSDNKGAKDPDDDADIEVTFKVDVKLYEKLALDRNPDNDPHEFSVRNSASDDTRIGTVTLDGARKKETVRDAEGKDVVIAAETVTAQISNSAFKAKSRTDSDGNVTAIDIFVKDMDMLTVGAHNMTLTANAPFLATRTTTAPVLVNVTASNPAPTLTGVTEDGVLAITYEEDDAEEAKLVLMETGTGDNKTKTELHDFSKNVSDSDNELDFILSGDSLFKLENISELMLTRDIVVSTRVPSEGPPPSTAKDNTNTDYVDESQVYYTRSDSGKFSNDESKTNIANDDVTYDLKLNYTDGANPGIITVRFKVNVNDQVKANATGPDDQTYSSIDPFNHPIINIEDFVSKSDSTHDEYKYTLTTDRPSQPFIINEADGKVTVQYTGTVSGTTDWSATEDGWNVTVTVDDGFENSPDTAEEILKSETPDVSYDPKRYKYECCKPDAAVTFNVKLKVEIPIGEDMTLIVSEDTDIGMIVGSLADLIVGVATYEVFNGTGGAQEDFMVDNDGNVRLVNARDYDAAGARNSVSLIVNAKASNGAIIGTILVAIEITNVNEAPVVTAPAMAWVYETAQADDAVQVGSGMDATQAAVSATDEDGDTLTYSINSDLFGIDSDGKLSVAQNGMFDTETTPSYDVTVTVSDGTTSVDVMLTINILNSNEAPVFDPATALAITIDEDLAVGMEVLKAALKDADPELPRVFKAIDPEGDVVEYSVKAQTDTGHFNLDKDTGVLTVNKELDYETQTTFLLEINAKDPGEAADEIQVAITIDDVNDNPPVFAMDTDKQEVVENEPRGKVIATYVATDADASAEFNTLTYKDNSGAFHVDQSGNLMTLESLDYDSQTPCGSAGCEVTITATDDGGKSDSVVVTVTVKPSEDSVSTFTITKANPVPGVTMGEPMSALADTKVTSSVDKAPAERPGDLPATEGDGPDKFVETQWANWGTVLRIAVTSPSPDPKCGEGGDTGNRCVFVEVEGDSSGHKLKLQAYRSDTPAGATSRENLFIAAVMVVNGEKNKEVDNRGTYGKKLDDKEALRPVYKHDIITVDDKGNAVDGDNGVARLVADEEDEISIRLVGSTAPPVSIDVENEKPEFGNFRPEHESAFDDGDVDYTFTIIDSVSGIPEPEDLPDVDGDNDYMPMVALISTAQCHSEEPKLSNGKVDTSFTMYERAGNNLWCKSAPETRQIVDDRDFDEIDDGFDIDTKIVLPENKVRYVSFIVCDAAGNCALYTPDENDTDEALAEITIDTVDPKLIEARTGIKWDSTDSEYDDDRSFIQVLFEDLTALNPDTIESDDFVVEGHTIKAAHWYDVSDNDDDTRWGDDDAGTEPSRYADGGKNNLDGHPLRRSIRNVVFLELEDELAPDETPDVTVVPNGVEDSAGNEQDDGDVEAQDWISPSFTVTSIVSSRTPEGSSNVLAGDGDEVVITLTSDERIQQTRPDVSVTHVDAPAGSVYTDTDREACRKTDDPSDPKKWTGTRVRGEIVNSDDCMDSEAEGEEIGTSIEKVSNTEWIITVDEPDATGYYSFYVSANDRSSQKNPGSEGVKPSNLVKDFFERDGDVNSDDAHYFQGDINLSNPGVRVSGVQIEDTEPAVEFKTPLFVELDFTRGYIGDCTNVDDKDELKANCRNEKEEYAKDSFENVTVTSFVLNGVDMTDSVKTTDDKTFLVSIDGIGIGDHEIEVQAMDQAGNTLDKALSIEFEVEERDPFSRRLNPGWNLVSLPGEPADSDISVVFGSNVEVRTVYTYDPIIPGGWMVAVRETLDSDWQGDLMDITARRGYWVLSDAIQDWEVSIPRLAGGAVGSGTPIQPPVIGLYAGWNLIPVVDVRGGALDDGKSISATAYLNSLDDGLDLARVLGFNTITNTWTTVLDPDDTSADAGELRIGSGYWVFVREAASLVPGGIAQ